MRTNDDKRLIRPSKTEFVLDNLFAVELLIFPYILLIFRKPTWTSMNGAVAISILCPAAALVGCLFLSFPSKRSGRDICWNMLTVIGVTAVVLYAEWFPGLVFVSALIMAVVICGSLWYINQTGRAVSKRMKRRILMYSRRIIAAVSIVLIVAAVCLRISIFKDTKEDNDDLTQQIERQKIEYVDLEYSV